MLVKSIVAALGSALTFRTVLAQGDLGTLLPTCAVECAASAANANNCVLLTPQCLCPAQPDIRRCISRSCKKEDLGSANSILGAFCLAATPSSFSLPLPTILPTIQPPPLSTTNTPQPPSGSTTPSSSPSSQPNTSLTPSTTSTSSTTSTPSSTLIIIPTPSPSLLSTSEAPQTVVVFSTQFAPPAPITSNGVSSSSSFHNNNNNNAFVRLFVSVILSGFIAMMVMLVI